MVIPDWIFLLRLALERSAEMPFDAIVAERTIDHLSHRLRKIIDIDMEH